MLRTGCDWQVMVAPDPKLPEVFLGIFTEQKGFNR